jgi:aryl-alcohol dehydrogenase-like predicted oxidoreductase
MERKRIAGTDLQVSPLCLGTMTFGTPVGERDAIQLVHQATDLGISFIDTANMYQGYSRYPGSPGGVGETILGRALTGRRDGVVIATKVGMKIGPRADDGGLSPGHVRRECDRSLGRLQTDRIDLYYMHKPDPETPLAESIDAFAALIEAGKVRHWGLSNFNADQVGEVLQLCDDHGFPRPVAHQPAYSLLKREIEGELLPLCLQEGLAVVPYQVLQGGLLTGKYRPHSPPPAGSRGAEKPDWLPLAEDSVVMAEVQRLTLKAESEGVSLYDYTLRTTLAVPGITSIILGVKRSEQIEAAVRAVGVRGSQPSASAQPGGPASSYHREMS